VASRIKHANVVNDQGAVWCGVHGGGLTDGHIMRAQHYCCGGRTSGAGLAAAVVICLLWLMLPHLRTDRLVRRFPLRVGRRERLLLSHLLSEYTTSMGQKMVA
jgi:hypothetical protein